MRLHDFAPKPIWIDRLEQIPEVLEVCRKAKILGVDSETLGLVKEADGTGYGMMTDRVVVFSLSPSEDTRYLLDGSLLMACESLFVDPTIIKAISNAKFDAHRFMNTAGVKIAGPWADTVHLDFLLDEDTREGKHGLKACVWDYFQIPMQEYKTLFGSIDPRLIKPGHPLWDSYFDYASLDAWAHRKLAVFLLDKLEQIPLWEGDPDPTASLGRLYWAIEEPQLRALWEMERRGVPFNRSYLRGLETTLAQEVEALNQAINREVGEPINPGSTQQVAHYLYDVVKLPILKRTPSGAPSTDEEAIFDLAYGPSQNKVCQLILEHRKASKILGTYIKGLLRHLDAADRIHSSFSTTQVTGRLASTAPNLQNLPKATEDKYKIRGAIEAPEGCMLVAADYSQIEMRLLAFAAEEPEMIRAINEGLDMHAMTAATLAGLTLDEFIRRYKHGDPETVKRMTQYRDGAKAVGFGIVYGITKYALSKQLSEKMGRYVDEEEAQTYIDAYLNRFPGVRIYMATRQHEARTRGYVQTILGRRRRLRDARYGRGGKRGRAERQAINAPIQGSAGDIVKIMMVRLSEDAYLTQVLGFELVLQVHDELVWVGPEQNAEAARLYIKEMMENPFPEDPLPVKLKVDAKCVKNYRDAK